MMSAKKRACRWVALLAGCVLLAGTAAAADHLSRGEVAKLVAHAKAAVSKKLKDPDSALFRGLFLTQEPSEVEGKTYLVDYVCGEVNAKNSYGGFVGYRRFVVVSEGAFLDSDESSAHDAFEGAVWARHCQNKVRDLTAVPARR